MEINKRPTIENIDALLRELNNLRGEELRVPQSLGFTGPLVVPLLAQLLITWASKPNSRLRTHFSWNDLETPLTDLGSESHGFLGMNLADEVWDRDGKDITSPAREAALQRFEKLEVGELPERHALREELFPIEETSDASMPLRGGALFLPVIDSPIPQKSRWLYDVSENRVRSSSEFDAILRRLLRVHRDAAATVTTDVRNKLGEIFHELFANTDQWATTDLRGTPLAKSVRGMHLRILSEFEGQHAVKALFRDGRVGTFVDRCFHDQRARLLEISIFDSGPGYAQRISSRATESFGIPEEYDFVSQCMSRHGTSGSPNKHFGLTKVLRFTDALNAFVFVRSGRLSLFRDFSDEAEKLPPQRAGEFDLLPESATRLRDFGSGGNNLTEMPFAAGVTFSILVPLK